MFAFWESNLLLIMGKVFFMVIGVVYLIFAFMVIRQVNLMNRGFTTPLHAFFNFWAWVHFFAALLALVLAILLL